MCRACECRCQFDHSIQKLIVHTACNTFICSNFTMQDANVDGALRIASVCSDPSKLLINVSCMAAHSAPMGQLKSTYLQTKAKAELSLRDLKQPNIAFVRASTAFGHEDRLIRPLGKVSLGGSPIIEETSSQISIRPVSVFDMAEGIKRLCLLHPSTWDSLAFGKTFNFFGYA